MKKGFTLVELSIVLVIIGLLIGGILVAQSMIGTAKIQALIRQTGQYDAAVENFMTKYNQMPGDATITANGQGNNNGIIEGAPTNDGSLYGESAKFYYDLAISGLKDPGGLVYANGAGSSGADLPNSTLAAYYPKTVYGGDIYYLIFGSGTSGINYYMLAGHNMFKPADALAYDTKTDDGVANTGQVRANNFVIYDLLSATAPTPGNFEDGSAPNECSSGASYLVSSANGGCNLRVRIGTGTGNPH